MSDGRPRRRNLVPNPPTNGPANRTTAVTVLLAVSMVVTFLGAIVMLRSGAGVTAHLFLPVTKWLEPTALTPVGPASEEGLEPGLRVAISERSWRVADTDTRVLTGVTRIRSNWDNPFEARWRGYLLVKEPGVYLFHIWGHQDVVLSLDGETLGGFHAPWHRMEQVLAEDIRISLEPGLHAMAIDQRSNGRPETNSARLAMDWTPPGGSREEIPAELLWADDNDEAWSRRIPEPHLAADAPERPELARGHLTGIPMGRPGVRNSSAFYAAFADKWDHSRFGLMHHFPGYEILWRGRLRVDEGRVYRLRALGEGAVRIQLAGEVAQTRDGAEGLEWTGHLDRGWHDLRVSYVSPWAKSSLVLEWDGESAELGPISPARLRPLPEDRVWFGGRRLLAWTILGFGLVGLLTALALLHRWGSLGPASLRAGLVRGAFALSICLIMLLGLGMRLYRYDEVPDLQLSSDELHNARKGWQMLNGGGLRAWTPHRFLEHYDPDGVETEQWGDLVWERVTPNFDRPPLFPLLVGVFDAVTGRAENVWDLGPSRIRILPISLSVLSIPLVVLLTRRFYGGRAAPLLAGLLYATVPMIVLNHRQAKSDLLVVVFVLSGLLAACRHLERGGRFWLYSSAVAAGLACWSKEIGIVAVAIIPYVWLRERRWREGFTVAAIGAGIFALYFVWGSLVDFRIFWDIIGGQASQASGFDAAWIFLTEGRLVHVVLPFAAGWTLWLWFCVAYAAPRDQLPALAAISFLILISGVVRVEWVFGWYWVPIYPFLCMAGGVFLFDFWRRPDLVRGALFVLTALFMAVHAQRGGEPEALTVTRGATLVCLLPFALATFFPHRLVTRAARVWVVVVVAGALALGAYQLAGLG